MNREGVVEESQGIAIARQLVCEGYDVTVFDPVATESARLALGESVHYAPSIAECVRGAAVVVLATDWPEFRSLLHQTANSVPRPVIVDGWRMLRSFPGHNRMSYHAVGLGGPNRETRERLQHFAESLAAPRPSKVRKQVVAGSIGSSV